MTEAIRRPVSQLRAGDLISLEEGGPVFVVCAISQPVGPSRRAELVEAATGLPAPWVRLGLYDAVLIKDNHLAQFAQPGETAGQTAARAVRESRRFLGELAAIEPLPSGGIVEIEVDSLEQLAAVLPERPEIVLLDNMTLEQLREGVAMRNADAPEVELEASGGVNLETVRGIAETGVDRISVGGITHAAKSLDVGLDWSVGA